MKRYFFVLGIPKSGTTFMQMLLNAHPQISCPSEHQFDFLIQYLTEMFEHYNKVLVDIDNKTARQGASIMLLEDLQATIRFSIEMALLRGRTNDSIKICGANDNGIIDRIPFYINLFPEARFICIVRDPRDVAVSSWHHNLRVEEGFVERARNLADWTNHVCRTWGDTMSRVAILGEQQSEQLVTVRYEDLVSDGSRVLPGILHFLGVSPVEQDLEGCFKAVEFSRLSGPSQDGNGNPFFRKGREASWREELDDDVAEKAISQVRQVMDRYHYHYQ